MTISITLRAPYDFSASIGFWHRSTAELTEQWADGVYRRLLPLDGRLALLTLRPLGTPEAPAVQLELEGQAPAPQQLEPLARLARRLLNDELDLTAAQAALRDHPQAGVLLARYAGLKATRSPTLWEALVWAICAQQIGLSFALRLKERLVRRFGETRQVAGRPLSSFPPPARLALADPAELRGFQLSANKARFIVELAQAIESGQLDLAAVEAMPTDAALEHLVRFRGVGRWTAEYALLRGLGRADAFPAADAGVRNALVRLGAVPPRPSEAELRAWAAELHPWEGLVAVYLWRWLHDQL